MSDYTRVNFTQMENTREALLGVVSEMDRATDELITKIKATLGDSWTGATATYFEEHRKIWDAAEAEMGRQLNEAAIALGVANDNYKAAEARNKAIWAG
ncbi:WXG100 family type VII secretion target [Streptosporangium sp. NPDC087985]|uniref:WXG100 family type VII secretion target n=1 Tax=Streptosporangium sp. NPDC087985 TaxID=3366196 RepID=UPI00380DA18E